MSNQGASRSGTLATLLCTHREKCVCNRLGIKAISPELVLRDLQQECFQNPNEISALDPELVLRDVPGKSG